MSPDRGRNWLEHALIRLEALWVGGRCAMRREEGQTLVEYALILVLVALVVIAVLTLLGGNVKGVFSHVSSSL